MSLQPVSPLYRRYALAVFLAVNLLNYIDRQVLYAVFPLIKADLRLSDTSLGLLGSAFMLCYMIPRRSSGGSGIVPAVSGSPPRGLPSGASPPPVPALLPAIARCWLPAPRWASAKPASARFRPDWSPIFFPRSGAAGSSPTSTWPSRWEVLLAICWEGSWGRNSAGMPPSCWSGLPGLLLALPLWLLREPARGGSAGTQRSLGRRRRRYSALFRNRSFVYNTLAMAAMTFALGGLAQWLPSFLHRVHGLDVAKANTLFGAITVLAGISGTLTGGWLGDLLQKRSGKGYLLVSGWGFIIGTPIAVWPSLPPPPPAASPPSFLQNSFSSLTPAPSIPLSSMSRRPGYPDHGLCRQHLLYSCPGRRHLPLHPRLAFRPLGAAKRPADHPGRHGACRPLLLHLRQACDSRHRQRVNVSFSPPCLSTLFTIA